MYDGELVYYTGPSPVSDSWWSKTITIYHDTLVSVAY